MSKKRKKRKQQQDTPRAETFSMSDVERLSDLFGARSSAAGVYVTEESAMRVSAVYGAVRLLCGSIATLPLQVFRRTSDGRELAEDHPLYDLLHLQPNPMLSAVVYWETVVMHVLLAGNHYSLIGRTRGGEPISLTPLKPSRVEPDVKDGQLIYFVTFDDGKYAAYHQDDILHIPNVGWNGKKGLSTIRYAAQNSVGTAMAADEYAARFFANDATPRGYLKFDKPLKREQAELIRDYWYEKHQGLDKSHVPAIISEGGEFKEISMSAEDAQILETRRFQVTDIARIFGVPPWMLGETSTSTSWGTGLEQQARGFVTFTLRPHLIRIQQEVNRKLFRHREFYAEFNAAALLSADTKGRHEAYQIALGGNQQPGWMSVNEVRKLENLSPVEGADEIYRPLTGDTTNETQAAATDPGQPG